MVPVFDSLFPNCLENLETEPMRVSIYGVRAEQGLPILVPILRDKFCDDANEAMSLVGYHCRQVDPLPLNGGAIVVIDEDTVLLFDQGELMKL